ncbi:MAG: matrixin family metalloprotease [Flavobacteriaceae bacterium]|nr:matrixin family metalloprotease [Flavobacteriaceae bacterium]
MSVINFNETVGVYSEDICFRLDIGEDATKKNVPAGHNSWATRLVIKRLNGAQGPIMQDDVIGIFTEDGKYRLDIGTDAMQKTVPASHNSWATRLKIVGREKEEGPIFHGDRIEIYSEDGKYKLDIGTDAMKKAIPADHNSWATRFKIRQLGSFKSVDYSNRWAGNTIYYGLSNELVHYEKITGHKEWKEHIDSAFEKWNMVSTHVTFEKMPEVGKPIPRLYIKFVSGTSHDKLPDNALGRYYTQQDRGGITGGVIYLNSDAVWSDTDAPVGNKYDKSINLENILLHEIGHALGLRHLAYRDSIMYSSYNVITEIDKNTIALYNLLYPST